MSRLIAQIKYEFLLEYRSWPQSLALFLYMCVISYILFRVAGDIDKELFNVVFWVIVMLISVNVVLRSTSHHAGSAHLLQYQLVDPTLAFFSRWIFNSAYLISTALLFFSASVLFYYPVISLDVDFCMLILLAGLSIAGVISFVSSLAQKDVQQSTLLSILTLPLLIPIVVILHQQGSSILDGDSFISSDRTNYMIIFGITLLSLALSIVLFPLVWKE